MYLRQTVVHRVCIQLPRDLRADVDLLHHGLAVVDHLRQIAHAEARPIIIRYRGRVYVKGPVGG